MVGRRCFIARSAIRPLTASGDIDVSVGDRIHAIVVSVAGGLQLSRRLARGAATNRQLEDAFRTGLPVEGKVEGSVVSFSFVGRSQGQQAVIAYSGAIERVAGKESMSGTIDFGGLMGGSWTANRRAAKRPRG